MPIKNLKKKKNRICIVMYDDGAHYPPFLNFLEMLTRNQYDIEVVSKASESSVHYKMLLGEAVKFSQIRDVSTSIPKLRSLLFICLSLFHTILHRYAFVVGVGQHGFMVAAIRTVFGKLIPLVYIQYEIYLENEWPSVVNKFESMFVKYADLISCVETNRALLLQDKANLLNPPLVVHNCPLRDSKVVINNHHPDLKDLLSTSGIAVEKLLIYQGGIGVKDQCIEELILSAQGWKPGVVLTIFGYGPLERENRLKYLINQQKVMDRIVWMEPVSVKELEVITPTADAGVVFWDGNTSNIRYAAPNKLFQYLQAGLAVIGSRNPLLIEVVEKNNIGICVNPRSPDQIADAINEIFSNDDRLSDIKQKARELYETKYNYEFQSKEFMKKLNGLAVK